MKRIGKPRIKDTVMQLYGDQINEYSRGCEGMTDDAVDVCIPKVVAITLPEEYASLVLTSRMDNELRKLIKRKFHRQGDADKLLFEIGGPFGTFSSKISASFSFGILTEKMHKALTCCRKLRNAFAHSDNPDAAKESKDYKRYRPMLLDLDVPFVSECVANLESLRKEYKDESNHLPDFSEVIAVMLAVTESLGLAAYSAWPACSSLLRWPCAYCGRSDAPNFESLSVSDARSISEEVEQRCAEK
jgi:hypothetical protein